MRCPQCHSSSLVKNGFDLNSKQRYQCKNCNLHFKQGDTHGKARKGTGKKKSPPISFRCSEEEKARLEKAAKELNLSVSAYICHKLDEFIKNNSGDHQMFLEE